MTSNAVDHSIAGWRACGASIQGGSHVRADLPCQDANATRSLKNEAGEVLLVAVADGAGSASRGAEGAALMVRGLADRCVGVVESSPGRASGDLKEVIEGLREDLLVLAASSEVPLREFACTVLCAVLHPEWSVFAQIGDGAIVVPEDGTDQWNWVFWPQRGEYANTTQFITDGNAMEELQIDVLPHRVSEIALFTDGIQHLVLHYETQQVHSPFFESMLGPLRAVSAPGRDKRLDDSLATYLSSPAIQAKADDDLTLLLASRGSTESS
ncbi:PP2C family serine/threonine-protein phosphatase [Kocuria sabuli]|uniref:PP2C family serine/threonine-protein phosphatase n=1 Tax=Kocuria sabuli TaxID=3071448 RepID=UPI0034D55A88